MNRQVSSFLISNEPAFQLPRFLNFDELLPILSFKVIPKAGRIARDILQLVSSFVGDRLLALEDTVQGLHRQTGALCQLQLRHTKRLHCFLQRLARWNSVIGLV